MQGKRARRTYRLLAIAASAALLLNTTGWAGSASADGESVIVTSSAQAAPATVTAGEDVRIDVTAEATAAASLLVDVEIFGDTAQPAIGKLVQDQVAVEANEAKTIPFTWHVPDDLPSGAYTISLGMFGAGWSAYYAWNAGAATVEVTSGSPTGLRVPSGVKAAPGDTSVKLTWDGVPRAGWYEVEADGGVAASVYGTAYTQEGLTPDTEHSYRVRARNEETTGEWSGTVTARTRPAGQSGGLRVDVKTGASPTPQMITPELEIFNTGDAPIALSRVQARYYFTIDSDKPLTIGFWSTVADKANVNARLVKMPVPSEQADYYLEIGFTEAAGTLNPGAKAGVYTWINKSDWSNFDQRNDYSYSGENTSTANPYATAYADGTLSWGAEPALLDIPPAPAHLAGTPSDTAIELTWDAVDGAAGYDLNADGTVIANLSGTAYVDSHLKPGTKHTYKLRTRRGDRLGVWSDAVTVKTTGEQALPAPVNFRGTTTATSIALSWSPMKEEVTGYELEVDGTLQDVGTATSFTHSGLTAGTKHTYRVRAKDGAAVGPWTAPMVTNTRFAPTSDFDVSFAIDPNAERAPISPYIYGTNDDLGGTENWKARRTGGNRLSTYNWENNASNAGSDYFQQSDDYVPWYYGGVPYGGNMDEPGIGIAGFHNKSLAQGAYTLATLQTAGYVAADKNGAVGSAETAPSNRWVPVYAAKNAPFSLTPDLNDNAVYMDEFVNAMVHRFGNASTPTGIQGYSIDNEPALWHETHPLMHPEATTAAEVLTKGIDLAKAVKKVDPYAEIYGPVAFSFDELYNMHGDPGWPELKGDYDWYLDYYLDKFRVASAQEGHRLLDVVDFHWYPEIAVTEGEGEQAKTYRITDEAADRVQAANLARLQAPRSLWDPTYTENTWIGQFYSSMLPILPRTQQAIDRYNPGTKMAVTEYNYGGETNIYGGIAQADALGIFGKLGVHLATFWKMYNSHADAPYISAAVKLFTNYDGQGSGFGDTKVRAETSNVENSSIYGSIVGGSDDELHLIVINKNDDYDMNAVLNIAGDTKYRSARVFTLDGSGPAIVEQARIDGIAGNGFTYKVPKLTVAHIVLTK